MFYNDYEKDSRLYDEFGELLTREVMLQEMEEHDLDEDSTDQEVSDEYLYFCDEEYDDGVDLLFPNGRDYDAEDEDGPLG